MKLHNKRILTLAALVVCSAALAGCDTYYYGLHKTSHRSTVNSEQTMYVHKDSRRGHREFGRSHNAKPVKGMHKQRKIRK